MESEIKTTFSSQQNINNEILYVEYAPLMFYICPHCEIDYKIVKCDESQKWLCSCKNECNHKIKID